MKHAHESLTWHPWGSMFREATETPGCQLTKNVDNQEFVERTGVIYCIDTDTVDREIIEEIAVCSRLIATDPLALDRAERQLIANLRYKAKQFKKWGWLVQRIEIYSPGLPPETDEYELFVRIEL